MAVLLGWPRERKGGGEKREHVVVGIHALFTLVKTSGRIDNLGLMSNEI